MMVAQTIADGRSLIAVFGDLGNKVANVLELCVIWHSLACVLQYSAACHELGWCVMRYSAACHGLGWCVMRYSEACHGLGLCGM